MFAITPATSKSPDTAEDLLREVTASISDILNESPKLFRITGQCIERWIKNSEGFFGD